MIAPRALEDSVRPRLQSGASGQPLNSYVRRHVTIVLVTLLYLAITAFTAWRLTVCLRTGVVTLRNGIQINRLESPTWFWASISPGICVLVLELSVGLWVAYQLWGSGRVA